MKGNIKRKTIAMILSTVCVFTATVGSVGAANAKAVTEEPTAITQQLNSDKLGKINTKTLAKTGLDMTCTAITAGVTAAFGPVAGIFASGIGAGVSSILGTFFGSWFGDPQPSLEDVGKELDKLNEDALKYHQEETKMLSMISSQVEELHFKDFQTKVDRLQAFETDGIKALQQIKKYLEMSNNKNTLRTYAVSKNLYEELMNKTINNDAYWDAFDEVTYYITDGNQIFEEYYQFILKQNEGDKKDAADKAIKFYETCTNIYGVSASLMLSGYMAKSEEGVKNDRVIWVADSNSGQKSIADIITTASAKFEQFKKTINAK